VPYLLAFDTSTETCSVALLDGDRLAASREVTRTSGFGGHSEHVLQLAGEVLDETGIGLRDLSAIAFGAGPGAFTGLRVACAVAQGLALGIDCLLVTVDCLAAIGLLAARSRAGASRILVVQDARMGEVYLEALEVKPDVVTVLEGPLLMAPDFTEFVGQNFDLVCGSALPMYASLSEVAPLVLGFGHPSAFAIGLIGQRRFANGEGIDAALAAPLYVRDRVALTIAERQAGERMPS
jgi:tRNA threonylcarbamoyladenosine biosynthesis protein TsaB